MREAGRSVKSNQKFLTLERRNLRDDIIIITGGPPGHQMLGPETPTDPEHFRLKVNGFPWELTIATALRQAEEEGKEEGDKGK